MIEVTVRTTVTSEITKIRFLPITMTFYTILDDIHSSVNYKPRQTVIPPRICSVRFLQFALDFYDINKIYTRCLSTKYNNKVKIYINMHSLIKHAVLNIFIKYNVCKIVYNFLWPVFTYTFMLSLFQSIVI